MLSKSGGKYLIITHFRKLDHKRELKLNAEDGTVVGMQHSHSLDHDMILTT